MLDTKVSKTSNARVILHVDLDCFYCQVEQQRLAIPRDTPVAVQQWEGLIAVNYAARAKGVTRHMRVAEAKAKCPEIQLVHVETIGGADGMSSGHEADRLTQKACLGRYRRASTEVLAAVRTVVPGAIVQKASIDEFYIDCTALVDRELQGREERGGDHVGGHVGDCVEGVDTFAWGSIVIGGALSCENEFDVRLAVGAGIACRVRGAVREQCGFTCSAGIAANKLCAKIASAMNKPNQQTLVPARAMESLLHGMPLRKIRNFGGKLGDQLAALDCETAGQVLALEYSTLVSAVGAERAAWIQQVLRGNCDEPVQERERPKSMLAAKSMNATSCAATLRYWLLILAQELCDRMVEDEATWNRKAKNLVLHYRGGAWAGRPASEHSRSVSMPKFGLDGPKAEPVSAAAFAVLESCSDAWPCSRVALSVTEFVDMAPAGTRNIAHYFAQGSAAQSNAGTASPPPKPQAPSISHRKGIHHFFAKAAQPSSFAGATTTVPQADPVHAVSTPSDTKACQPLQQTITTEEERLHLVRASSTAAQLLPDDLSRSEAPSANCSKAIADRATAPVGASHDFHPMDRCDPDGDAAALGAAEREERRAPRGQQATGAHQQAPSIPQEGQFGSQPPLVAPQDRLAFPSAFRDTCGRPLAATAAGTRLPEVRIGGVLGSAVRAGDSSGIMIHDICSKPHGGSSSPARGSPASCQLPSAVLPTCALPEDAVGADGGQGGTGSDQLCRHGDAATSEGGQPSGSAAMDTREGRWFMAGGGGRATEGGHVSDEVLVTGGGVKEEEAVDLACVDVAEQRQIFSQIDIQRKARTMGAKRQGGAGGPGATGGKKGKPDPKQLRLSSMLFKRGS